MREQGADAFGLSGHACGDQHAEPSVHPHLEALDERVECAVLAAGAARDFDGALEVGLVAHRQARGVGGYVLERSEDVLARSAADPGAVRAHHAASRQLVRELLAAGVELGDREVRRAAACSPALLGALGFLLEGPQDAGGVFDDDRGVRGKIAPDGHELGERGEIALETEVGAAGGHVLDETPSLGRGQIHGVAQTAQDALRALHGRGRDDRLASRRQPGVRHVRTALLIIGIEGTQAQDEIPV
jgi:hypothetical protein